MQHNFFCYIAPTIVISAIISCGPRHNVNASSGIKEGSGIKGKPYAEIISDINSKTSMQNNLVASHIIAKTPSGTELILYRIARPQSENLPKRRPAIFVSEAIHGNEYLNIVDRLLIHWITSLSIPTSFVADFIHSGGILYVVPIANPWGYENQTRYSEEKIDLNREFPVIGPTWEKKLGTSNEIIGLINYLEQDLKDSSAQLSFALDYHCCMAPDGAFLYPWAWAETDLNSLKQKNQYLSLKRKIASVFPNADFGNWVTILQYSAAGTSTDYFYSYHNAVALTYEAGRSHDSISNHTKFFDIVFNAGSKAIIAASGSLKDTELSPIEGNSNTIQSTN